MKKQTEKIVLSGLFIALGVIIPPLFHAAGPGVGQLMSPMHFPILIAGIIVGWKYGLAIGILTPILSALMPSGMPFFPVATVMAAELGVYGLVIGLVYENFRPFKTGLLNIYLALIIAMLAGRIVGGSINAIIMGINGQAYGLKVFLIAYFVKTWPAILLQFLVIPPIIEIYENKLTQGN